MAENTINDFNTLPEQVQINKEDIESNTTNIATNTADITKLKDDISKIKSNAWEERKFKIDAGEGTFIDSTTCNPITDINTPLNSQKTFADKDTYSAEESINSYSYNFSFNFQTLGNIFTYVVCADPSCSIANILDLSGLTKKGIFLQKITSSDNGVSCDLYIYCTDLKADKIRIEDGYIEHIANSDDSTDTGTILSASVINYHYLRKTQALETYLSKSDASNIYAKKSAINTLEYDYFDAVLTTTGFTKIQANATIGTSINLVKDTDFTEDIYNTDIEHKTVIFNLYKNDENIYISTNIKLDIGRTTSYYSDNDQPYTWYTGVGVIKLGPAAIFGNSYLCYIAYDATYNNGLIITPIQKLS